MVGSWIRPWETTKLGEREVEREGEGVRERVCAATLLAAAAAAHHARDVAHRRALAQRQHLVVEPRHLVRVRVRVRVRVGVRVRVRVRIRD